MNVWYRPCTTRTRPGTVRVWRVSVVLGSSSGQASSVSSAVPGGVKAVWGGLVLKNSLGKTSVCGSCMPGSSLEIVVNADLYWIGTYSFYSKSRRTVSDNSNQKQESDVPSTFRNFSDLEN